MPMCCSVSSCIMHLELAQEMENKITFFSFPKEPNLKNIWIKRCARKDPMTAKRPRMCSLHFRLEDFERDLQSELLNLPPKLILKKGALPSLNLGNYNLEECAGEPDRKKNEDSASTTDVPQCKLTPPDLHVEVNVSSNTIVTNVVDKDEQIILLNAENLQLKKTIIQQQRSIEKYRKKINSLKTENRQQKESISLLKSGHCEEKVQEQFKNIFTPKQLELILNNKKIVHWQEEDITRAFTIRYFSKHCYTYLRDKLHYPLPGISTLQNWASKLDLKPGLLTSVFKFLEIAADSMSTIEKIAVLQYDEVKVNERHEYDTKHDRVIGPHSQMQVVNVRGLFASWKQPVYVGFDVKITPILLHKIINKLYAVGYTVKACVSDCGGSNVGLWRDLGVTYEHTYIKHQIIGSNIYFFPDAPHLLKLIRNWLLDTGFEINEKIINRQPFEQLIQNNDLEVSSCYKLTEKHVQCQRYERQNVTLAAQLLSHTTAVALKRYCFNEDTADFVELINSWFDIMNSRTPHNKLPIKSGYGLSLEEQNEILDKMHCTIKNMKCIGKNSMQIFQKGLLMSILSTKQLYKEMVDNHNIKYILTNRLNQDALENLFSQLRSRGGLNDHPTPLNAIYRLRMIILGKSSQLKRGTNTTDAGDDEYLVGKVLLQTNSIQASSSETSGDTSSVICETITYEENPNLKEEDGLEYLAGWMAKKLKDAFPELGDYIFKEENTHDYAYPSWVKHLSFGCLTNPSNTFKNLVISLNDYFNLKLGRGLHNKKNIVKKLKQQFLEKFSNIDERVVNLFIKQRVIIRINYLNYKYESGKRNATLKRRVAAIRTSMAAKKMKKTCT